MRKTQNCECNCKNHQNGCDEDVCTALIESETSEVYDIYSLVHFILFAIAIAFYIQGFRITNNLCDLFLACCCPIVYLFILMVRTNISPSSMPPPSYSPFYGASAPPMNA